jgi:hypothetical protein
MAESGDILLLVNGDISLPEHFLVKRDFIVFKDDVGAGENEDALLSVVLEGFVAGDLREDLSADLTGVFERYTGVSGMGVDC